MRRRLPHRGGELYSWGSGEMGQLGFPRLEDLPKDQDGYPYQPVANKVDAFSSKICHVAGGDGHTAAVTASGQLYSWGASACGQLGHSDTDTMPKDVEGYPYQPVPRLVESLRDTWVSSIACGDAHTVAVGRDGCLFAWGGGGCGQLGHSETSQMPKDEDGCPYQPTPREVSHLRGVPIIAVACGKAHTVAVARDGRLFTWGAGACGQLGHPDTSTFPSDEDGYPFQPIPREVESMAKVKNVSTACGDVHTLVLSENGDVYAFGGGSYGQLGIPDVASMPVDADQCPYTPTPQRIPNLERIISLACGDSHSLALDEEGVAFCWGANSCGQLGLQKLDDTRIRKDSDGIPHLPVPLPVEALKEHKILGIACGEAHSLAVTAVGDLYSWGACSCGQLGLGTYMGLPMDNDGYPYQSTPTRVSGFNGKAVVTVACGGVHNLAITEPDTDLVLNLGELAGEDLLADISVRLANGALIPAHRCILVARAPMLAAKIDERGEIHLPATSKAVFEDFLYYVYSSEVAAFTAKEDLGAILELYDLAKEFAQEMLVHNCKRILRELVGARNPAPHQAPASGWGLVFLADGSALVLDGKAYAEMVSRGRPLDLDDRFEGAPDAERWLQLGAEHQQQVVGSFRHLLESEVASDVTLVIEEGERRRAHKSILACRSAYFKALFGSEFRESVAEEVALDLRADQLDALLKFFYADEWRQDLPYALDMMPIADRFQALELKQLLERFLVNALCGDQLDVVAQVFAMSDRYNCPRLRGRCIAFMAEEPHFSVIVKSPSFAELEKRLILEVLHQAHKAPPVQTENFPGHFAAKGTQSAPAHAQVHRRGWLTYAMPAGGARSGGRQSPARPASAHGADPEESASASEDDL